jgi:hypothetical protein
VATVGSGEVDERVIRVSTFKAAHNRISDSVRILIPFLFFLVPLMADRQ